MTSPIEVDALIVGAGFGGVYQLKRLREEGFKVKLVDGASDFGGVWYWNRYSGARADSPSPFYAFSDPEIWSGWRWSQRFPGHAEMREYFAYVADKWDLRKDTLFQHYVTSATWSDTEAKWTITILDGPIFKARFFLPNTGFAARRYIPDFKGLESFKGTWIHPSYWPMEGEPDLKGKKIAVIGTGSTGIQLVQELAPLSSEFVLFQRTLNLCLPMGQKELPDPSHEGYAEMYSARKESYIGTDVNLMSKGTFDDNPEERKRKYEELWKHGDFQFWLASYRDMLFEDEANTEAYNFWRDKVRERIQNPRLKEKFAPTIKPFAYGCKRVSLEEGFYENFEKPNVHLVDVNDTPIVEVTPRGIRTSEKEWEFDVVICATGFDAITGGILQLNVTGQNGVKLDEKWKDGVKTYLGLCVAGFPNMFFTYGPQAPTAFCNGPTCAELQGEWIVSALKSLRDENKKTINASAGSEKAWVEGIWAIANMALLVGTKSWQMGDNIPGKVREPLIYLGGVPAYYKSIGDCAEGGYEGFVRE